MRIGDSKTGLLFFKGKPYRNKDGEVFVQGYEGRVLPRIFCDAIRNETVVLSEGVTATTHGDKVRLVRYGESCDVPVALLRGFRMTAIHEEYFD